MARSLVVDVDEVVASVGRPVDDELTDRILDAAEALFAAHGIRRCSVEEIAERSGLGRTSVYRRFDGRQQIIEAVLARACRRFFASLLGAVDTDAALADAVVDGFVAGLYSPEASLLAELVRAEPEVLRMFTVDAAPVIAAGSAFLVQVFGPVASPSERRRVQAVAELLMRLAISVVLSSSPMLPLDDEAAARAALHGLLDPLLVPLATLRSQRFATPAEG